MNMEVKNRTILRNNLAETIENFQTKCSWKSIQDRATLKRDKR
jgi:hypothetical protein